MKKTALADKGFPMELEDVEGLEDLFKMLPEEAEGIESLLSEFGFDDIDEGDITKEVDDETGEVELSGEGDGIVFKLSVVPGADDEEVIELDDDEEEDEVVMDEKTDTPLDSWDWEKSGGPGKFLNWLQSKFSSIPKHSGQDTTGVERALSYFQRLDTEISKAMKKDFNREIDSAKAEEARTEIEEGMDRLIERLEKLRSKKFKRYNTKKKSELIMGMVKNAETTTSGKMIVTIPYMISSIARACIESAVQGGKDIEDSYNEMTEKFGLDKKDKYLVAQLIKDMNYPILLDRLNFGKEAITPSKSEKSEYMRQYYA